MKLLLAALALILAGYYVVTHAAAALVVNEPVRSDVILVLGNARDESRLWHGVALMDKGYAPAMIVDVPAGTSHFGVSDSDLAQEFVAKNAPGRASVCEISSDSTVEEAVDAARCLQRFHPNSVLLVTSAYHTRSALAILMKRLPQYQWHVAAQGGPLEPGKPWVRTADEWWRTRRWAETVLDEWEKWVWWLLVERWRARPVESHLTQFVQG